MVPSDRLGQILAAQAKLVPRPSAPGPPKPKGGRTAPPPDDPVWTAQGWSGSAPGREYGDPLGLALSGDISIDEMLPTP